jgi:hypothetical protein
MSMSRLHVLSHEESIAAAYESDLLVNLKHLNGIYSSVDFFDAQGRPLRLGTRATVGLGVLGKKKPTVSSGLQGCRFKRLSVEKGQSFLIKKVS